MVKDCDTDRVAGRDRAPGGGVIQELDAGLETCTPWNGLLPFVPDVMR